MRPITFIKRVMRNLRYGVRLTLKAPGFTAAAFAAASVCLCASPSLAQVAPTWVHRFVPDVAEKAGDLSTANCHYQPIFGKAIRRPGSRSVARFAEVKVDPQGACRPVSYEREEQIYFILEGSGILHYGEEKAPVRKNDFMYLPPGVTHTISGSADQPCRVLVMGFKIPAGTTLEPPPKLVVANMDNVKEQTVKDTPRPSSINSWSAIGRVSETGLPPATSSPASF